MNGDRSTALSNSNSHRRLQPQDVSVLPKIPEPKYRHAAPSTPWPWIDFNTTFSETQPFEPNESIDSITPPWKLYPKNFNWTSEQVKKSKMLSNTPLSTNCLIHKVDVDNGYFVNETLSVASDSEKVAFWDELQEPVSGVPERKRTRIFFINNLSSPVLQMLGTSFRIGPSFFSSLTNWIPSRHQEDLKTAEGDHITIVLPFVRVVKDGDKSAKSTNGASSASLGGMIPPDKKRHAADFRTLLYLRSTHHVLLKDLLAIHMVRTSTSNTIVSYHPPVERSKDSAERLQLLVLKTGDSPCWSEIFKKSNDPTFLVLVMFWYVLYGWDETFEVLGPHIDWLVSRLGFGFLFSLRNWHG
ncbi:hypothetical protein PAXINDRAFT_12642 [Paxillus involutus ATCC 200175]|uniref:Uncharacterized protein n=1 Tax=Paxillus involutus ATCC 200175 TaxID=664439 RepID=A0A0C9U5T6_PAXIN|nr:hypothetical protein PAXINDRAFT_12642 [Paxillus involutus ATCC 200175]